MKTILYYFYKCLSKQFGHEIIINYYRSLGMTIGKNTHVFSRIVSSEPFLITIGNNVTISTGVNLLTHDASIGPVAGRDKYSDLVGPIIIGDNCFIGANSILLCGTTIPGGSIVAAGSVVTKTVICPEDLQNTNLLCSSLLDDGIIIGGNPAKFICKTSDFVNKREFQFLKLHGKSLSERKVVIMQNKEKWVNK